MARFLPKYGNGSILVMTRNKEAGSRLVPGQPLLEVGPMSDGESVQMIREITGDSSLSMDAFTVLSNRLENLPLAIAQAAAFMHENCMSLDKYLDILNKSNSVEVQLLGGNFEAVGRDADVPHAVTATWVVSFEHIKEKNPLAADILSMMAFFDRQAIQRQFITIYMYLERDGAYSILLEQALGILKAFSFIKENKDGTLCMHRLVQLATADWLKRKGSARRFFGRALETLA
ncbi:uncharacterized protein BDZ83DRAFT_567105, partial [Colletotrichum acutatum]